MRDTARDADLTLFVTKGSGASTQARETLATVVVELDARLASFAIVDISDTEEVLPDSLGDAILRVTLPNREPVFLSKELGSRVETVRALEAMGLHGEPGAAHT